MTNQPALEKFLSRLLSRSTLSGDEQRAILQLDCRVSQFRARVDVVVPGERVEYACLIGEGIAARFDQMRNGQRQFTAFHIPGDMCDLHSIVAPTAAWGHCRAFGDNHPPGPARISPRGSTEANLALAFWRDGTADASILAKWLGNLGRHDARARLAHILCEFGIRMEQAGLGSRTSFELKITQEQLADALGLTPVHVNRTMQRLRGEGLVATHGCTIEILDWDRLAAAAEFDPAYLLLEKEGAATTHVAPEPPERSALSELSGR